MSDAISRSLSASFSFSDFVLSFRNNCGSANQPLNDDLMVWQGVGATILVECCVIGNGGGTNLF